MIGDYQIIGINLVGRPGDALKNVGVGYPLQFDLWFTFFMNGLDFNPGGIRQKRADDETRTVAERLHSEQRVGLLVGQFDEAAQFCGRENHAGLNLTESNDKGNCSSSPAITILAQSVQSVARDFSNRPRSKQ